MGVVGDEQTAPEHLFHHGVAALVDLDDVGAVHQGHTVIVGRGHRGQGVEHVHLGRRGGGALDGGHLGAHPLPDLAEQLILQGHHLVLGGQDGVLQLLQLLGDVPLGVHRGLLPGPVLGHQVDLGLGYLDVVAEHLVEADAHVLDARLRLHPGLHLRQYVGAVFNEVPQAVYLFVVAPADELALPHREGGRVHKGGLDQPGQLRQVVQLFGQGAQQGGGAGGNEVPDAGQAAEPSGQGHQVPAPGGAVHHPADEALQVGDLLQHQGELLPGDDVLYQVGHRLLPPGDLHRGEQGPLHPPPQQAAAHGGLGLVQHPQQGALLLLGAHGGGQLQGLPGGEVQLHKVSGGVIGEHGDVGQVGLLGLVQIGQQAAGGLDRRRVPLRQGVQPGGKLLFYRRQAHVVAEVGLAPVFTQAVQPLPQKIHQPVQLPGPVGEDDLGGVEAAQLVFQVVHGVLRRGQRGGEHLAGGDVAQAQAAGGGVGIDGTQEVVLPLLQHGGGDHRARGDDPGHVPLYQALGQGGVLHLFADGHLIALGDQPGDVAVAGVIGHAAHGGALLRGLVAVPGGQSEVQLLGRQLGVVVEHLVKVAQAEEEDGVGVLLLHLQILPHHGGHLCHGTTCFLFLFCGGILMPARGGYFAPGRGTFQGWKVPKDPRACGPGLRAHVWQKV